MIIYDIKKEGRFINAEVRATSPWEAIRGHLLDQGFKTLDLKDKMFMACWEAVESKKNLQITLQKEIISKTDINIVTCGNCSTVILHRLKDEQIECAFCKIIGDPCDFPDLNY
jgi:hypothetical protein